jgi:hypothetical protein
VLQYFAGVIAKLPIAFPDSIGITIGRLSMAWSYAFGSHSSLDCLLTPADGNRPASQAAYKALITLLLPVVMVGVIVVLQVLWWLLWPVCVKCMVAAVRSLMRSAQGLSEAGVAQRIAARTFFGLPRLKQEMWCMHMQSKLRRHPSLREYLRMRWTVTVLVVCFFFFPSIARVGVGMFACQNVCGDCYWVLDMAQTRPTHNPNSAHGRWAYAVGIPALMFNAAMPLLVLGVLWTAAHKRNLQVASFVERYGFMYSDYTVQPDKAAGFPLFRNWRNCSVLLSWCKQHTMLVWDAVIHVQTVALMYVSVYGMMIHEYYQVLILTVVFGMYLILIVWLRPFRVHANQQLQAASTAVLFGTSLCMLTFIEPAGLDMQQQQGYNAVKNAMGWVVLVVNALFVAIGAALLVASAVQLAKRTMRSEGGNDAGSADAVDVQGAA